MYFTAHCYRTFQQRSSEPSICNLEETKRKIFLTPADRQKLRQGGTSGWFKGRGRTERAAKPTRGRSLPASTQPERKNISHLQSLRLLMKPFPRNTHPSHLPVPTPAPPRMVQPHRGVRYPHLPRAHASAVVHRPLN